MTRGTRRLAALPDVSSVTVQTSSGSLGCARRVLLPTASGPSSRRSTRSTVGMRAGQLSTSTRIPQTRAGGALIAMACSKRGMIGGYAGPD
jgi:hypothetical protein